MNGRQNERLSGTTREATKPKNYLAIYSFFWDWAVRTRVVRV